MSFLNSLAIFNHVGGVMVLRWIHIFVGVVWLGAFTYFAFVHKRLAELFKDHTAFENVLMEQKRIAVFATATVVSGAALLLANASMSFYSSWGICVLLGSFLGVILWLNLLLLIGPAKKAKQIERVRNFSLTNLMFALPMLFFMGAGSHLGIEVNAASNGFVVWSLLIGVVLAIELYAVVGKGPQINTTTKSLAGGVLLWLVLYMIIELVTKVPGPVS